MKIKSLKDLPSGFGSIILDNNLKDIALFKDEKGNIVILLNSEYNTLAINTFSKEIETKLIPKIMVDN